MRDHVEHLEVDGGIIILKWILKRLHEFFLDEGRNQ
jgi:hypothetical protein